MDTSSPPSSSRRIHPPRYQPHARIAELRANGWTTTQIAVAIGASLREVTRWAAGDTRPLPIYEREIDALDLEPPVSVPHLP